MELHDQPTPDVNVVAVIAAEVLTAAQYPDPGGGPFMVSDVVFPDGSDGVFKFNPKTYEDDIGVVHLQTAVAVPPASLYQSVPSWEQILNQHRSLMFVGFGFNVIAGDMVGIGVKREAEINSVSNRTVSFSVPGKSTCYGDSGGPAFVEGNPLQLAGITSARDPDCTQGVDTRVDAYKSWLAGKII